MISVHVKRGFATAVGSSLALGLILLNAQAGPPPNEDGVAISRRLSPDPGGDRKSRSITFDGAPVTDRPQVPSPAATAAVAARRAAVADVSGDSTATVRSSTATSAAFSDGGEARRVIFYTAAGPRPAWRVIALDVRRLSVIDAADGKVLFQRRLVADPPAPRWNTSYNGHQRTVTLAE